MAVKLDISKAYNMVEWEFIEKVMRRMGFHEKWVGWVLKCITTITYSVLINGEAHGQITPTRGLRQGEPLSSYLFLLCVKAFSALISDASNRQSPNGASICRGCPRFTHLVFANDSLLFCKAEMREVSKLVEILKLYKAASRQKINTDKSLVNFSLNTLPETRSEVLEILGPMQDSRQGKYLGLPSVIGKSKNQVFCRNKGEGGEKTLRLERKNALNGWKGNPNQSSHTGNPYIYYELLPTPKGIM